MRSDVHSHHTANELARFVSTAFAVSLGLGIVLATIILAFAALFEL